MNLRQILVGLTLIAAQGTFAQTAVKPGTPAAQAQAQQQPPGFVKLTAAQVKEQVQIEERILMLSKNHLADVQSMQAKFTAESFKKRNENLKFVFDQRKKMINAQDQKSFQDASEQLKNGNEAFFKELQDANNKFFSETMAKKEKEFQETIGKLRSGQK